MIIEKSIYYLLLILIFSCQNKQENKKLDNNSDSLQKIIENLKIDNVILNQKLNEILTTKYAKQINSNQDIYNLLFQDEKPSQNIQILKPGECHMDDIIPNAEYIEWYGLFKRENKFILEKIKLIVEPTQWGPSGADCGGDANDTSINMSGRLISSGETTEPIIFIAGLENLTEGEIESVKFEKHFVEIGQCMRVQFKKCLIEFCAYGSFYQHPDYFMKDYLLETRHAYCEYPYKKQIFAGVRKRWCGDNYSFYWAGDIDRDGMLDLILELPSGESDCSGGIFELFLSSKAANDQLIKKVAVFSRSASESC